VAGAIGRRAQPVVNGLRVWAEELTRAGVTRGGPGDCTFADQATLALAGLKDREVKCVAVLFPAARVLTPG